MNKKLYGILRGIALIWLPALGTFVFAFTDIWHLDHGAQIVGTIMAVDAFLGAGLGIAKRAPDGELVVDTTDPVKDRVTLNIGDAINNLPDLNEVRLKVVNSQNSPPPGTPVG